MKYRKFLLHCQPRTALFLFFR